VRCQWSTPAKGPRRETQNEWRHPPPRRIQCLTLGHYLLLERNSWMLHLVRLPRRAQAVGPEGNCLPLDLVLPTLQHSTPSPFPPMAKLRSLRASRVSPHLARIFPLFLALSLGPSLPLVGQDGSYLAELLLSKGYVVHGLIRRSSSFNTGRIEHMYRDKHSSSGFCVCRFLYCPAIHSFPIANTPRALQSASFSSMATSLTLETSAS
jgi:hypothetical protein